MPIEPETNAAELDTTAAEEPETTAAEEPEEHPEQAEDDGQPEAQDGIEGAVDQPQEELAQQLSWSSPVSHLVYVELVEEDHQYQYH